MLSRVGATLRRIRRFISRSEWLAYLLHLPLLSGSYRVPGLIMIQIDGLSKPELEKALQKGELPFLRQLIDKQHYRLHSMYAGLPTTTAAFQAELFYDVKQAVPGFNFMQRASGQLVRMFEPAAAARVERELKDHGGEPLLKDGSCYADNFTGGAKEAHFCPSAHGWGPKLREANMAVVSVFIISNFYSFLRVSVLLVVEIIIAFIDCIRGLIEGQDLMNELKLVPARVIITIMLRELATIGVEMDVVRGLPIIHLNFLGYDEQAHRRGPTSLFAHWTLKGIDDAISRIWQAAHRSERRHYDVWIYSDHGQEQTQPYEKLHGRAFSEAIASVFAQQEHRPVPYRSSGAWGIQAQRVGLFGGSKLRSLFSMNSRHVGKSHEPVLTVAPLGPVAMLYYEPNMAAPKLAALAEALVQQANIPLVLIKEGAGQARAWTSSGEFVLPQDGAKILGAGHPYLEPAVHDLIALCHHPDAGEFTLCGWRESTSACSFAVENGAHGGAGPNETSAFALLPADISLGSHACNYIRATDLRHAAFHFLDRSETQPSKTPKANLTKRESLRIMTYNVHSCIGMDGTLAPERIARMIARYDADIIALQELDVGRLRSGDIDQCHLIARYLEMEFHFHPAMHVEEERYGDAILTHLPMRLVKMGLLPGLPDRPRLEPRGAIWVAIDVGDGELQVINTHLGLSARERQLQVNALLGDDWLAHPDCHTPVVLCGDFNALPVSAVYSSLSQQLNDAQHEIERSRIRGTFPGHFPKARIDHVFITHDLDVVDIEIPTTELARIASDHLPLIVEMNIGAHRNIEQKIPHY